MATRQQQVASQRVVRTQHKQTYEPPPKPPSRSEGEWGWLWLAAAGLVATYLAAPWAARIGQGWVERIFGGGGGGIGGGGGGPPCLDVLDPACWGPGSDLFNWGTRLPEGMQAAALLLLFLCFLAYWAYLVSRLPLKLSWQSHLRLSKAVKPSPFVIVLVVGIANSDFLMTYLGRLIIDERMWTGFISAILGFAYVGGVAAFAPGKLESIDVNEPAGQALNRSRSAVRYVLTLLAAIFLFNTGCIAASLIPNAIAAVPPGYSWWCVIYPVPCVFE
jgi:hypothetical protein